MCLSQVAQSLSCWILKITHNEDCITCLGSLLKGLTVLMVKIEKIYY